MIPLLLQLFPISPPIQTILLLFFIRKKKVTLTC